MNDADLDNDGLLSLAEFEHVMGKTPEFAKYVFKKNILKLHKNLMDIRF